MVKIKQKYKSSVYLRNGLHILNINLPDFLTLDGKDKDDIVYLRIHGVDMDIMAYEHEIEEVELTTKVDNIDIKNKEMFNMKELTTVEFEEVLDSGEDFLIDFYSETCGPCGAMAKQLEGIANPNYPIYKIRLSTGLEIFERYDVKSVPTLIHFSSGEVQNKSVGFVPKAKIREKFNI